VRDSKKPRTTKATNLPKAPPAAMIRALVLAAFAILACIYAIFRTVTHRPAAPPPATEPSASDEVPAPPLVPIE